METTHCQICERPIKANTGLVAHHGYQRPWGEGWQTSSCMGARFQPYEVACDAIQPCIDVIAKHVELQKRILKEWMSAPPERFTPAPHYIGHKTSEVVRPDVFDAVANLERSSWGGGMSYEYAHASKARNHRHQIESGTQEIKRLKKRLANWKHI